MIRGWLTPSSPIFISFHWQSSWSAAWMKYLRTQSKSRITLLSPSVSYLPSVHRSAWFIVRTTWPLLPENPLNHFNRPTWSCVLGGGCSLYCNRIMLRKKVSWCALKSFKMSPRPKEQPVQLTPLWPSQPSQGSPEVKMEWNSDLGLSDKLSHSTAPVQLYSPYSVV